MKKRSAANSRQQPEINAPVLFLDRNLGKHVIAERLRSEGLVVEIHDDHLRLDAPDEDWLKLVAREGWVALTKDKNIRYRAAEIAAIRKYGARVVVVRAKNATAADIAELLLKGKDRITRFAGRTEAPFVAGIDRTGRVTPYQGVLGEDP